MNPDIIASKNELCKVLKECGFIPRFVATDGDNGMDAEHNEAFKRYESKTDNHHEIVLWLFREGWLKDWPISDLLHLMKNARARLALAILAFIAASSYVISGDSVTDLLARINPTEVFKARKPLDLLEDYLAIHAFSLENFIALCEAGDVDGAYFLLPFVCLNLATRNPYLDPRARLELLSTAFEVFFDYAKNYPKTGPHLNLSVRTITSCSRKTFWTQIMCKRACNLCVGLYFEIFEWMNHPTFPLALGRISSHPCECHFGTVRSTLNGDTRAKSFVRAEINAVLIRRSMVHLGLHPYIRRFKTDAGCTLTPDSLRQPLVQLANFNGRLSVQVRDLIKYMRKNNRVYAQSCCANVNQYFKDLALRLGNAGWVETAGKSSPLSGGSITLRLFTLSRGRDGPDPENTKLLEQLADQ
jgi:hypothetical protein